MDATHRQAHEEIESMTQAFLARGGTIQKLPMQWQIRNQRIAMQHIRNRGKPVPDGFEETREVPNEEE